MKKPKFVTLRIVEVKPEPRLLNKVVYVDNRKPKLPRWSSRKRGKVIWSAAYRTTKA